jgi:hypothetical protein
MNELSAIVAIIGLVIYLVAPDTRPRVVETGRLMFAIGLFIFLLHFSPKLF